MRNGTLRSVRFILARFARRFARELLIILAFCAFTAVVTWPYVTSLRDAAIDAGDPYFVSWILWWDYHATFNDPINLFHANIFYPLRYTLAFSEHCYGVALPFFPLFALGLPPLTVHAIAVFFGFALCGYAAFRLARTLNGLSGTAWIAGIVFAFVPYRFQLMQQLPYLFSPWLPLLFEALVLFARARTKKRAAWLGFAFFMTGLTAVTWVTLSLVPLALSVALLLTRYRLWRDHEFWWRGAGAVGLAALALLPFMLPYLIVSKLYGFTRRIEEVHLNSAWPFHWLAAHPSNKLWGAVPISLPSSTHRLFPGSLPIVLSLAAVLSPAKPRRQDPEDISSPNRWLTTLDGLAVILLVMFVLTTAFDLSGKVSGFVNYTWRDRLLALLLLTVIARVCIAYPRWLRFSESRNLIETLRSPRRSTSFWLGMLLTLVGFSYSLGWNFFFYRLLFESMPFFKSMREPRRGAMFAYIGLALLAALGTQRLAQLIGQLSLRVRPAVVYTGVCFLLLFELNAAPLRFIKGDALPDAVTLRLKETSMRGGVVILPAGPGFDSRQTLRAADHAKPLIGGMSGFRSYLDSQIEQLSGAGPITSQFLESLERIPASYLVVQTHLLASEQRPVYDTFLARSVASGRLRFINRFDGRDDLYAITKTEPEAQTEAVLPFSFPASDWATMVADDPINLLGLYQKWSQKLFRVHVASFGGLPRFADFVNDAREIGRDVFPGPDEEDKRLEVNFQKFVDAWVDRPVFKATYDRLTAQQYVSRLYANAGLDPSTEELADLVAQLSAGRENRAGVLLRIAEDPRFVDREDNRSFVVLHYFGYLRRNPGDPPDQNLDGMLFWLDDLARQNNRAKIPIAFRASGERLALERNGH
jgi:hypothetical protein